ncbi:Demethylmenaquinone methyltransferase [Choanephora cucurbitarum]|uniref:Demethylmenaquinone methyltransferase n=1 Tax=Choanephora cucurbitarum TaxID=101091 RepID=A0A1C7NEQ3_9FUNG|nr:Demethylmenaquinone methyltransferase [Choanephora cucurbitarum]
MGNTSSSEDKSIRRFSSSKPRRQSNRSSASQRLASSHSSFSPNASFSDFETSSHKHESILSRIKHKANRPRGHSHTSSVSSNSIFNHHLSRLDFFANSLDDDLDKSATTSPSSMYSNQENTIEKYTDSQMTLLSNGNSKHNPLAGIKIHNDSSTTIHSITTNTIQAFPHKQEMTKAFSCDLLLKELYASSETSPERRRERDRRHRQHYLLKRIWGSNHKVPLENPTMIIDWCCGTAVWDLEMAFEFPKAQVVGIDYESFTVSGLTNTVKNFSFRNALIHQGETGLGSFSDNQVDYVMIRDSWLVNSSTSKWTNILKEVYRILKPGGYIELYEQDSNFESLGPHFTILENWATEFYAAIKFERNTVYSLNTILNDLGYTNIQEESVQVPIGEWPQTEELKETGYLQRDLVERKFREGKRWICKANSINEKEFSDTLTAAMEECDRHSTTALNFYFCAQKPH